jgi:hypothetical protein
VRQKSVRYQRNAHIASFTEEFDVTKIEVSYFLTQSIVTKNRLFRMSAVYLNTSANGVDSGVFVRQPG